MNTNIELKISTIKKALSDALEAINKLEEELNATSFKNKNTVDMPPACFKGTLTRDAELRTTKTGRRLLAFNLKLAESVNNTIWANAEIWFKPEEICEIYLKKGDEVELNGVISLKEYNGKQFNRLIVKELKEINPAIIDGADDNGDF